MKIIKAEITHLNQLLPLFDAYRTFYKQSPDIETASKFLSDRFNKKDSVIFLAFDVDNNAIGFVQLYPTFSSVSIQHSFILNDLFVAPEIRGIGAGKALLNHAKQFAIKSKSKGLSLETDIDNPAQKLYEKLGWEKDLEVLHYTWKAKK